MENRERERAFIVRGDCEVIRPFVAKVIEQFFSFFFFFFILLSRGITSGSTSLAQSGSISVLCVRLQSTRRSNIYSNTCVVCKLVARMRIYGPLAHICIKASAYTEKRCRVRVRSTHMQGSTRSFILSLRSKISRKFYDELLFYGKRTFRDNITIVVTLI